MARLEGKVCLVTGAASYPSLGYATALLFAKEGARLIITDIDEKGLESCASEISKLGGDVVFWRQDVTSEADWEKTLSDIEQRYGQLDVLVNNAGIAVLKSLEALTLAEYERQMQVNMTSVFMGTKSCVALMRKTGSGGSIVNMSSIAGLVGVPGVSAYAASKAGVRLFSKTIAMETAKDKIRCNTVHPGVINTNMQQVSLRDNPEQYDILNNTIPVGRMGEPEEVAQCVLFLASDESRYVTGTELVVDGGLTAQ